MATSDLIDAFAHGLEDCYTAVEEGKGTITGNRNLNNLPRAIKTIAYGSMRPPLPDYPYDIPKFDGGEYGAVAYLRDDNVHYYTATSSSDLTNLAPTTESVAIRTFKTLDDGFKITSNNILAYSIGSKTSSLDSRFLYGCPLLQNLYFSDSSALRTINGYFLNKCGNFHQPLDIPKGVTSLGTYFMAYNPAYNQPITFPSTLTSVSTAFMYESTLFNQPLYFYDGLTGIGGSFLKGCSGFNSEIIIPDTVTTLGSQFLFNCISYNKPFEVPAGVSSIGSEFMSGCSSFNSKLSFRGHTESIGNQFMWKCISFNQPIEFPEGLSKIGEDSAQWQFSDTNGIMAHCTSFNQPMKLPDSLQMIGWRFLYNCSSFNSPITFGKGLQKICAGFLSSCIAFNQDLILPEGLIEIKATTNDTGDTRSDTVYQDRFMYNCKSFNSEIRLPSTLYAIPNGFLSGSLPAFNKPLDLSHVTSIGRYFMMGCTGYTHKISLPENIISVGKGFLRNCNKISTVDVNNAPVPEVHNHNLATSTITAPMYVDGVTLTGENAQLWKDSMPDSDVSPYRKILVKETA